MIASPELQPKSEARRAMNKRESRKIISEILKHFGGQRALARRLGCTSQAINMWRRGDFIPLVRAYQIQSLSDGKWTVENMPLREKSERTVILTRGTGTSEAATTV
jgi:hypothetical protein